MPLNFVAQQLKLLQGMLCFKDLDANHVDTLTRIWQPHQLKGTEGLAVIPKGNKVNWLHHPARSQIKGSDGAMIDLVMPSQAGDMAPNWAEFNLALAMLLFHAEGLHEPDCLPPLHYHSTERPDRAYFNILKEELGPDRYLLTPRGARQYRHAARVFPGDFLVLPIMVTEEDAAADKARLEDEKLLPLDAFSGGVVLLTNQKELAGRFKFEDRPVFQHHHLQCPGSQHRDPRHPQGTMPSVWRQLWSDVQIASNIREHDSGYVLDDARKSATIVPAQQPQQHFTVRTSSLWGIMPPWM